MCPTWALFFCNLIQKNEEFKDGNRILMGDLNTVMDINLDRTGGGGGGARTTSIPSFLKDWVKDNALVDSWCCYNQTARHYTFYSGRHQSYLRID